MLEGELRVELFGEPPRTWRVSLDDGATLGAGDFGKALPFRPYAVIGDEVRVEARGGALVERVRARVGAPRARTVALGDSNIHQGLLVEALVARGAPRMVVSGRAGGDSAGALARLESDALAFEPRSLLLWVGSNDLGYAEARGEPPEAGIPGALENIGAILSARRERGIACCALGALPRGGVAAILEFNRRLGEVAKREGAAFFDPYEALHRRNGKLDIRYSDGLHPNAAGAERLADWLAERGLVEALKS